MHGVAVITLIAFVVCAHATKLANHSTNWAHESMDKFVEKLVHKVVDQLGDKLADRGLLVSPLHQSHLDSTTFGKPSHSAVTPRTNLRPLVPLRTNQHPTLVFQPQFHRRTAEGRHRHVLMAESGAVITIDQVSCSHDGGDNYQLKDVTYVVPRGSKQGLVGRNGCGKSTLLQLIAKEAGCDSHKYFNPATAGQVITPRNVRVGFVEQEPPMSSDVTVGDSLLGVRSINEIGKRIGEKKEEIFDVIRRYRLALQHAEKDPKEFEAASAKMDQDAWSTLARVDKVASKLRVLHLESQPLSSLSGGERKRVALAAELIREPDVLLLDEPTNHLDLAAIQWLSDLIIENKKLAILVVTHDRAFLESVTDTILELDNGLLYKYDGNYATYLEGKEKRIAVENAEIEAKKIQYKRELEWMRKQPKARGTKSASRIEAFNKLEKAIQPKIGDPNLKIQANKRRLGKSILTLKDVTISFGPDKVLLKDFSYDFAKGDRVGIVGRNGVGKSTFVRMLSGLQPIASGERLVGETIVMGVYDQMGLPVAVEKKVKQTKTVMEYAVDRLAECKGQDPLQNLKDEAVHLLQKFEFPPERWEIRITMLSGGERRRLQLLSILIKNPNFLILDEPTNDLDLNTMNALEQYLEDYQGVLVVVSHDKFFTDKVTDHLFVFEGNGMVKDYPGSLSEYAECLLEQEEEQLDSGESAEEREIKELKKEISKEEQQRRKEARTSYNNKKKEMKRLEKAIEKLQSKAAALQKEIDSGCEDGWTPELTAKSSELEAMNKDLAEKEEQWMQMGEDLEMLQAEVPELSKLG